MIVSINNPIIATLIFSVIFFGAWLILTRRGREIGIFPNAISTELKGLAILMVVFSHIGYFLVSDTRFLWPLSIAAGVGVNLFLFLSGYGLTMSSIAKQYSIKDFYKRRAFKLFIPLWLILIAFFVLDYFVLKINYGLAYYVKSFFGIFIHANLYADVNSPLWYFTFTLFYYLVFPLVFFKKKPWLSALIIYLVSFLIIAINPPVLANIIGMYRLHLLAFPLGMLLANLFSLPNFSKRVADFWNLQLKVWFKNIIYYLAILACLLIAWYYLYHSGVGQVYWKEELASLIAVGGITVLFLIKKVKFLLLSIFGQYSYEIYLLHWPLLYRYDLIFKFIPPYLALSLYLILFLGLGWGMQKISKGITG